MQNYQPVFNNLAREIMPILYKRNNLKDEKFSHISDLYDILMKSSKGKMKSYRWVVEEFIEDFISEVFPKNKIKPKNNNKYKDILSKYEIYLSFLHFHKEAVKWTNNDNEFYEKFSNWF